MITYILAFETNSKMPFGNTIFTLNFFIIWNNFTVRSFEVQLFSPKIFRNLVCDDLSDIFLAAHFFWIHPVCHLNFFTVDIDICKTSAMSYNDYMSWLYNYEYVNEKIYTFKPPPFADTLPARHVASSIIGGGGQYAWYALLISPLPPNHQACYAWTIRE